MSITNRSQLLHQLNNYSSSFAEEEKFIQQFVELLTSDSCYHRDHLPGHITGSSWIVNKDYNKVLLVHHAKLNKWLQPGGHADGDENITRVALREAEEETGLLKLELLQQGIFDIDIHPIPARKDFPEHLHYDVRFIFQANDADSLMVTDESHDVKWFSIEQIRTLTDNASIHRMISKVKLHLEAINTNPKAITTIQNL